MTMILFILNVETRHVSSKEQEIVQLMQLYLTTDVSHFNKGKQEEVKYRYKHTKKTFGDEDDKY